MEILIFAVCCIMLVLGWAAYWVSQESFWDRTFDLQEPRERPKTLPKPKDVVIRDFGLHGNPLALSSDLATCDGWFEQLDERTWQCLRCRLVHFEKAKDSVQ